jgi:hypothetical protein
VFSTLAISNEKMESGEAMSSVGGRRAILIRTAVVFAVVTLGVPIAQGQTQPSVPENLKPSADQQLRAHARASGRQIYSCDGSKWTLIGPDAKLYDDAGHELGIHFAGPTWQWSDGSRVTAKPIANATPDPESIPWLLLTATSHTGYGAMMDISSIQRLQTKGGKAPAGGCGAANNGAKASISYTATYYFYAPHQ